MSKIKVRNVSSLSFSGYSYEEFDTLAEAFASVAEKIEMAAFDGDSEDFERFEVEIPGGQDGHNVIEIDARYVDTEALVGD